MKSVTQYLLNLFNQPGDIDMRNTQTTLIKHKVINGLDINRLVETVEAISNQPDLGQFEFRTKNTWINGGENRSVIKGFYGAGVEDESRQKAFEFTNGEPPVLLGNNEGANPVEFVLHALAGCITTTIIMHAAARGITIYELSSELDGKLNLNGFLDLDDSVPVSYEQINFNLNIQADCSDEELDDLIMFAKAHSPTCNTITKPVPVNIQRM